jgi:DNA-binding HxlR family transcriptional regulator
MSNAKKMTKREMFEMIKANHNLSADEIAFIDHELELLAKKNSAEKKPTAVQVANEGIKADILDGMEIGKKYTITDLMKEIPACAELSNQRVSALVRQLVTDGAVERTEEKRKAYFSKVA